VSPETREASTTAHPNDDPERGALLDALDAVLRAFTLERVDADHFRAAAEPGLAGSIYGGQLFSQALLAAGATVPDQEPDSMHAYFVQAGVPGGTLDLLVDRVRDGRSVSTRRVAVVQGDRTLLVAIASFHTNAGDLELAGPPPPTPPPEELPSIEEWVHQLPPEQAEIRRSLLAEPLAFEQRMGEAPTYLGGAGGEGPRAHWMRLPRPIGDDPALHRAMLAYASDHLLMDMVFRAARAEHGAPVPYSSVSLDHTVWFHRPVRFDAWHLYTQEAVAIIGERGLTRGVIHDEHGRVVATAAQAVLLRPTKR
jgi:acyl-CoA thioesterase-2